MPLIARYNCIIIKTKPPIAVIDGRFDIMVVKVTQQPVNGSRSGTVIFKLGQNIWDKSVVIGSACEKLMCCIGVIMVEVLVQSTQANGRVGLSYEIVVAMGIDTNIIFRG